jgi:hypothetical protein
MVRRQTGWTFLIQSTLRTLTALANTVMNEEEKVNENENEAVLPC